jgi:hypothetical protein
VFRARKSAPRAKAGDRSSSPPGPSVIELLAERRLTVAYMDGEFVAALCRLPGRLCDLGYDAERGWWCSCGAPADCAHLAALKLVTEAAVGARERTAVVLGREDGTADRA